MHNTAVSHSQPSPAHQHFTHMVSRCRDARTQIKVGAVVTVAGLGIACASEDPTPGAVLCAAGAASIADGVMSHNEGMVHGIVGVVHGGYEIARGGFSAARNGVVMIRDGRRAIGELAQGAQALCEIACLAGRAGRKGLEVLARQR